MSPFIGIDGDDVAISDLVISDPVLARVLSEPKAERETLELFADICEIGARVVRRHQDGDQGEMLRREVDRLEQLVNESSQALIENAGEDFAGAIGQVMSIVSQQLATISGRLDGALAVSNVQAEVDRERERGTAKGISYEEEVAAAVDALAGMNGDGCDHVGAVSGIGGKVGDVLVEIDSAHGPARGRIIFECKTGRLSRPEALRELDRAREQRDAAVGVLVVPTLSAIPAQMRMLREYGGDKLVCVYDSSDGMLSLEVAYSLARARALMTAASNDGVDVSAAQAAVEKLVVSVDELRRVKSALTGVQSSIESTKTMLDTIESSVRTRIAEVSDALASD